MRNYYIPVKKKKRDNSLLTITTKIKEITYKTCLGCYLSWGEFCNILDKKDAYVI